MTGQPAMTMPRLSFAYDLTQKDLEAFFAHVACRADTLRRVRRVILGIALGAPLLTLVLRLVLQRDEFSLADWAHDPALVPLAIFCVGWLLVLRPLQRWGSRLQLRRQLRGVAPGLMLGPMRLDVTDHGLLLAKPGGDARFAWVNVTGIEEAPGYVFIMMGKVYAIVLPLRGIAAQEIEALRDLVRRNAAAPG